MPTHQPDPADDLVSYLIALHFQDSQACPDAAWIEIKLTAETLFPDLSERVTPTQQPACPQPA